MINKTSAWLLLLSVIGTCSAIFDVNSRTATAYTDQRLSYCGAENLPLSQFKTFTIKRNPSTTIGDVILDQDKGTDYGLTLIPYFIPIIFCLLFLIVFPVLLCFTCSCCSRCCGGNSDSVRLWSKTKKFFIFIFYGLFSVALIVIAGLTFSFSGDISNDVNKLMCNIYSFVDILDGGSIVQDPQPFAGFSNVINTAATIRDKLAPSSGDLATLRAQTDNTDVNDYINAYGMFYAGETTLMNAFDSTSTLDALNLQCAQCKISKTHLDNMKDFAANSIESTTGQLAVTFRETFKASNSFVSDVHNVLSELVVQLTDARTAVINNIDDILSHDSDVNDGNNVRKTIFIVFSAVSICAAVFSLFDIIRVLIFTKDGSFSFNHGHSGSPVASNVAPKISSPCVSCICFIILGLFTIIALLIGGIVLPVSTIAGDLCSFFEGLRTPATLQLYAGKFSMNPDTVNIVSFFLDKDSSYDLGAYFDVYTKFSFTELAMPRINAIAAATAAPTSYSDATNFNNAFGYTPVITTNKKKTDYPTGEEPFDFFFTTVATNNDITVSDTAVLSSYGLSSTTVFPSIKNKQNEYYPFWFPAHQAVDPHMGSPLPELAKCQVNDFCKLTSDLTHSELVTRATAISDDLIASGTISGADKKRYIATVAELFGFAKILSPASPLRCFGFSGDSPCMVDTSASETLGTDVFATSTLLGVNSVVTALNALYTTLPPAFTAVKNTMANNLFHSIDDFPKSLGAKPMIDQFNSFLTNICFGVLPHLTTVGGLWCAAGGIAAVLAFLSFHVYHYLLRNQKALRQNFNFNNAYY